MISQEWGDVSGRLEALRDAAAASGAVFFPIRHHSPACSHHLRELIRALKPASVLVEGPPSFERFIPLVLHEKTRPPFAIYTSFADKKRRFARSPRYAAFYPFCEYSPEWIALREGHAAGARLGFIDLDFADQVLAEKGLRERPSIRVQSLQAESYFASSAFVRKLAGKLGCRDHDDLWDHLFEASHREVSTDRFVAELEAYCLTTRLSSPAELLDVNGTLARERAMAAGIRAELARPERPVLVVTGGFHSVHLPHLVLEAPAPDAAPAAVALDAETVMMRYSFDQLDALNGYGSGMPSPHYYQRLWELLEAGEADPFGECAARILVEVGGKTRETTTGGEGLSTADEIAALAQAHRLAVFRGHAGPTREDLLDAIRGTFVKGEIGSEGAALLQLVRTVLAGSEIGEVPPEAGLPALVLDFRRRCAELGLDVSDTARKPRVLDLYRKKRHRMASRFFHCLGFLDSPFALLLDGPDFVNGMGLDLLNEHWEYAWSPNVESGLIDRAVYGTTIEEAAVGRLFERVAELEAEGHSRDAGEATALLVRACRMGLHDYVSDLLSVIEGQVSADASFTSIVRAISQLVLLWSSREPLEAHHLVEIPRLAKTAYERACFVLPELAKVPEEAEPEALYALVSLREVLSRERSCLDGELYVEALERVVEATLGSPAIHGGAAGVLFSEGRLDEEGLSRLALGQLLRSAGGAKEGAAFLRGLVVTCRDAVWRLPKLLSALDELLSAWDEDDFLRGLPDLRLAFSSFTPREIDRLAARVAALHGESDLGELVLPDASEEEVAFNLRVSRLAGLSLSESHLDLWASGIEKAKAP